MVEEKREAETEKEKDTERRKGREREREKSAEFCFLKSQDTACPACRHDTGRDALCQVLNGRGQVCLDINNLYQHIHFVPSEAAEATHDAHTNPESFRSLSSPSVLSSQNTASSGTSSALYYHSGHGILRNLISSVLSSRSRHPQGLHVTDLESTPCLDAKSAFTTEGTRELLSQIQVTMTWEHRIRLPAITCYNRCLEALKATEAEPLSPVEFSFSLVWRHDLFQR